MIFDFVSSRGRGSYRGRGRGNFYRDRNAMQHHQHQPSAPQSHPNVPYYDHSMNLINANMASGQGGYNEGVYHDAQPNRYDRIYIFSKNFIDEPILRKNGWVKCIADSIQHFIRCIPLALIVI